MVYAFEPDPATFALLKERAGVDRVSEAFGRSLSRIVEF